MADQAKTPESNSKKMNRRELVRKGAKAAYVVPAVLAAIKATERPAYAAVTCPPALQAPGGLCLSD